jgi:hypothetical protein
MLPDEQLVVVVVVTLIQVLTEGMMGTGTAAATNCCGLAIGPHTAFGLLNSSNHSFMAFRSARRGWYMLGERVEGTSSPTPPSSVSVSNLISALTESSVGTHGTQSILMSIMSKP